MKECNISVMMFGGRRCGKTSVIAAMKKCFENIYGENSNIVISLTEPEQINIINDKYNEIESYFNDQSQGIVFDSSSSSTTELSEYKLKIELKNKKSGSIILNLCDYPGEWLDTKHTEEQKILIKRMKKCRIILIAVDTVYLMEKANGIKADSVGIYNENRNYSRKIADMVKTSFKVDGEGAKMIMIVPLKCEKYYNNNQMNLLNKRIHTAYKPLFEFLGGSNRNNYEVVITPILTLGEKTAEFARFERNEENEIIIDPDLKIPEKAKYNFVNIDCKYSPKYCEQPLLYSLSYLLDWVEKIKAEERQNANLFKKLYIFFNETFGNLASVEDFLDVKNEIKNKLKKDKDGYQIVSDPLNFR